MSRPSPDAQAKLRTLFDRRRFLKTGALGALTFQVAGAAVSLTPAEARARGADVESFDKTQIAMLDRLGDTLLPGAAGQGFAHFIDRQVSVPHGKCLSMVRYMDWPPPYAAFYKNGLTALDAFSKAVTGRKFAKTSDEEAANLIRAISGAQPDGWSGPPAPLFYFVTRADAVDVVYGTMEGFERLDVPYLPHIEPPAKW